MQLDFKYEIIKLVTKCKHRDIIISIKTKIDQHKNNKLQSCVSMDYKISDCVLYRKIAINYYKTKLRYYSFGFMKQLVRSKKIPAYYTYNINNIKISKFSRHTPMPKIIAYWDTVNVRDMSNMFCNVNTRIDINALRYWNVSNVKNMRDMFNASNIKGDISALSNWNVSRCKNMQSMFCFSNITGDICALGNWNTAKVKDMSYMFYKSKITGDIVGISNWNVSNVINMSCIFARSKLTGQVGSIRNWNVKNVIVMECMFADSTIGGYVEDIKHWNKYKTNRTLGIFDRSRIINRRNDNNADSCQLF